MDDLIIGGYRRMNVMQTGQNSEVWEVADITTKQRFAMKLLLPEKMHDPDQIRMLRHEAAVGAKLQHPKIIRIYGLHREKDLYYILMEYFPSRNLKLRLLQRGQADEFVRPRLRQILEQTAAAVGYMHEKRWVHRDIKPDNVLVNSVGEVRLIDFALAVRAKGGFSFSFRRNRLTAGTRSYMSPEQIRGQALDGRADIYSFGVMIYELVSGKLPHVALTGNELLRKHLYATIPPIDRDRKVTPEFEELLMKMLEKKPQNRPQSMQEILNHLRSIRIFLDEEVAADSSAARGMFG